MWSYGTYSLYKIVVLPALSRPTIMIFTSALENSLDQRLLNKMPIWNDQRMAKLVKGIEFLAQALNYECER
jgi:hypothetical protein